MLFRSEKETAIAAERRDVAAVYANRIRQNWRLDADPTVIYGIYGGKGLPPGKSITRSDLNDRNAYNTYRMRGLPAGPVAIPGEASLMAAANPSDSEAMFFVADGSGGHIFANTLEEHNANVRKWRSIERGETPPPASDPPAQSAAASAPAPGEAVTEAGGELASLAGAAIAAAPTSDAASSTGASDPSADASSVGTPAPGTPVPLMRPR